MSRIDLPDGGWADLADPRKVSERRRRPVVAALAEMAAHSAEIGAVQVAAQAAEGGTTPDVPITPELLEVTNRLQDAGIVALVAAWSYDGIPITVDGLLDLPGDAYTALQTDVAPLIMQMLPSFDASPADPKAPPQPSGDSTSTSEAIPQ